MKKQINWPYFLGLLNTDGSIFLLFKKDQTMTLKYRVVPVFQIALKEENNDILFLIEKFLKEKKIASKVKNKATKVLKGPTNPLKVDFEIKISNFIKNKKRSWAIEISGIDNVRNLILEIEKSKTTLMGLKYFDFFLMKEIYIIINQNLHNTFLGRQKIIEIKGYFHEPPSLPFMLMEKFKAFGIPTREIKPIPISGRYTTETWYKNHGFPVKSTLGLAEEHFLQAKKGFCFTMFFLFTRKKFFKRFSGFGYVRRKRLFL